MNWTAKDFLQLDNRLEEGIHEFLKTDGNNQELSNGLMRLKRYWIGPTRVPLSRLVRCCGPENDMEYIFSEESFKEKTDRMESSLENGWEPPPLIIEFSQGKWIIRDGNHRYEALRRAGIEQYWVVGWFTYPEELAHYNGIKPAFFFVTGTCGAGKTTVMEIIRRKNIPYLRVHDFDEVGVPIDADTKWRKERTGEWLKRARVNYSAGKSTVIFGVTVPEEIRNSPDYNKDIKVHYGLIRIGEDQIRTRLNERGWPCQLIEDNVIWSKHLEQYVRVEPRHIVVEGQGMSPEKTANLILDWILRAIVFIV